MVVVGCFIWWVIMICMVVSCGWSLIIVFCNVEYCVIFGGLVLLGFFVCVVM